jgi:hypothetical protein
MPSSPLTRTDAIAAAGPYMALINQCYPLSLPYEWVVSEPVEYAHAWYFTAAYAASQPRPAGYEPLFTGPQGHLLVRDTGLLWSVG